MEQMGVSCTFMRGGTSKGMFFRWDELPADREERDRFLCGAIGSPDPYGRQLDGMGGGISSLSKAMLIRRSERDGIEIDYLFGQIAVEKPEVDYAANCGNLSAAVGAFAVDQGFVQLPDGAGTVRMFNENTRKQINCHLDVRGGRVASSGDQRIAGVAGGGAPIRLEFLDPGGARTGELLPLGLFDEMRPDHDRGVVRFSCVDAANPCVFVDARDLGLTACELPVDLDTNGSVMALLEEIRRDVGARIGLGENEKDVPDGAPKIALVGPSQDSRMLSGEVLRATDCDVQVRMISMGKPHLAIPLTGALCTAVAARIPGTTVASCTSSVPAGGSLRIGTPSGVVPAFADVREENGWYARSASVLRTARTLMTGMVYAPRSMLGAAE